jgi:rhodanese-related sulfurtransferase
VNAVMQTSDPDIYAVGDAVEVTHRISGAGFRAPLAGPANRGGRIAGEHAATGQATPMTPVLGTAVVRVFDKTAAVTGLTVRRATQLKLPHAAVLVQAGHHAGYYPGATPMVLKVVYDPTSGKVLGAQAVGGLGVDKRIDVIATAIHFGGTVDDLAGLDLAYAPMFGSARDPVHVAGFVAQNQRAGRVTLLPPDADLAGMQVVDVRMPSEIEAMPLDVQAAAIPLDDLRRRVGELDRGRPTVVVCASGLRSYNAARILQQSGFARVSSLSGGAGMRRHALASKAAVPVA